MLSHLLQCLYNIDLFENVTHMDHTNTHTLYSHIYTNIVNIPFTNNDDIFLELSEHFTNYYTFIQRL